MDSGFQVLDSRFFWSVDLGFLIPIVSGIPDSLSCIPDSGYWIPDFLFVEPGFLIPIVSGIPVSKTQESALQVLDS